MLEVKLTSLAHPINACMPILMQLNGSEVGAAIAIVNIGSTEADHIVYMKINARVGEISARVLKRLGVPDDICDLEQNKC
ncbi:hypothetical protein Tco_0641091 [Tanacetum coccineum]